MEFDKNGPASYSGHMIEALRKTLEARGNMDQSEIDELLSDEYAVWEDILAPAVEKAEDMDLE